MWQIPAAIAAGYVMNKLTQPKAGVGQGAQRASEEQIRKAVAVLEDLGVPTVEAQKIVLESPDIVGELVPEQLSSTEFEDVQESPELRQNQLRAIEQYKDLASQGLTDEDLLAFRDIQDKVSADDAARQATILDQMEREGNLDSGARLITQLAGGQASTANQAAMGRELAKSALQSRRGAIDRLASASGQLSEQDYGRQMGLAKEKSAIQAQNAAFKTQAAQQNLANRQSIQNAAIAAKNQQEMYNKGLIQQQYQNELEKSQGMANAYMGQATNLQQLAQNQANAAAQASAGNRELMLGLGQAAATAYASDVRVKTNIKDGKEDIKEMLKNVDSYEYDYKPGYGEEGRHAGVMAQDLENTELGKEYVRENDNGVKEVEYGRMVPALVAGLSDQVKEVESLRNEIKMLRDILKV